jgi:hypothetical protein
MECNMIYYEVYIQVATWIVAVPGLTYHLHLATVLLRGVQNLRHRFQMPFPHAGHGDEAQRTCMSIVVEATV